MSFAFDIGAKCCSIPTAFIAKQAFCMYGLEPITQQLDAAITKVATTRFGQFAGKIVGHELAMVFSIPATQFFSDLVYTAVKETVEAIATLVRQFFFPETHAPQEISMKSMLCAVIKKVVSVTTFFLSRAYFCHYGMPVIKTGVELALRHIIAFPPLAAGGCIAALMALAIAPTATFFLGDLVGSTAAEITNFLLDKVFTCF